MNKAVMNNKRSSNAPSASDNNKKLRQTTLPWAPRPQPGPSNPTVSPHFPPSRLPPAQEISTPVLQGQGRVQEREGGEWSGSGSKSGRVTGRSRQPPSNTPSFDSPSRETEDTPRQYFFSVPCWSRAIRRVNMASTRVRHLPVMQRIACQQLMESSKIIAKTTATANSTLYVEQRGEPSHYALKPQDCPGLPPCKIRVENIDTLKCAVKMVAQDQNPVGILNMANAHTQGGGWLEGTMAQEEQLCYRTTLIETLKITYYPIPCVYPLPGDEKAARLDGEKGYEPTNEVGLIYSPRVAICRDGPPDYHLYDLSEREPEIVSVFSIAALDLRGVIVDDTATTYENDEHREIMQDKIRLLLRVAARRKQRRLVLGALGCGVFKNPPERVARLFLEVFREEEFRGGWWREIVFAILSDMKQRDQNYQIFRNILKGQEI